MADIGKIAVGGFSAGAIKYVVLHGFQSNASPGGLVPCVTSMGFGNNAIPKLTLLGFAANPSGGSGAYYIFGQNVVR